MQLIDAVRGPVSTGEVLRIKNWDNKEGLLVVTIGPKVATGREGQHDTYRATSTYVPKITERKYGQ